MGKNNTKDSTGSLNKLKELILLFLKLGFTSFGGPAAFLAMTHDEVVKRRKWLDDEQFLDLVGATNLIPGPNAVEMSIHLGFVRAGWTGFILGGLSYTLPSVLIVMGIAWYYQLYGSAPEMTWILYAVKPVVIAIVAKALWFLGRKAVIDPLTGIVAVGVFGLYLLGFDTLALLLASGLIVALIKNINTLRVGRKTLKAFLPFSLPSAALLAPKSFSLWTLFFSFLKISSVLYGGGYVLLAFLQSDFVVRLGWLTQKQLLDAIAVGQVTPGPFFTTATFIGYILGGVPGAALATIGFFLPSIFFVALSNQLLPKMRDSKWFSAFLTGVNAASIGLMAAVTIQLGQEVMVNALSISLSLIALILFFFTNINTTLVILLAILFGLARFFIGG